MRLLLFVDLDSAVEGPTAAAVVVDLVVAVVVVVVHHLHWDYCRWRWSLQSVELVPNEYRSALLLDGLVSRLCLEVGLVLKEFICTTRVTPGKRYSGIQYTHTHAQ